MTADSAKMIHIQWRRSGIGFSHKQKTLIRSLGFRRLNQVVERPDTAQTRGLVAHLAHLVEVVDMPQAPKWSSVPEYTLRPPDAASQKAADGEMSNPDSPGGAGSSSSSNANANTAELESTESAQAKNE